MRRKKSKRKQIKILASLFTLAVLFCAIWLAMLHWKPDWIFLMKEQASLRFQSAEFKEIDQNSLKCSEISLEEINASPETYPMGEELMLINQTSPVPAEFISDITDYPDSDVKMDQTLVEPYQKLSQKIQTEFNTPLYIRSSYRTYEEQAAEKKAQPAVAAAAGTSEHETGLALDVYVPYYGGYGFLKSEAGQYVNRNCWKYGFIIRYPYGGEKSTGIPFEPWHLRYVGCPHAEIMYKNSWTLEKYLENLEPGKFYRNGQYVISRQSGASLAVPDNLKDIAISPDNQGFYILSGIL